jgi:hypothetical protein
MKNLLLLLLISGCAVFQGPRPRQQDLKETPAWVYAPYEACQEALEFCASGEGKSARAADAEARSNLAGIFEVKVQSELSLQSGSRGGTLWQAEVREEVQQALQASIEQILETVQIKKYHKQDGLTHALASLDRQKTSELLGHRLNKVDDELKVLWNSRQRTNFRRILRLYLEREKLNERFAIVAGQGRRAPMSYEALVKWRDQKNRPEPLVLRIGRAPDWMGQKVRELLTESGFKLVSGDAAKELSLNVESIREFLNVEGFEKYTFTLIMTSLEKGEKKKVLTTSETVTGRNQSDALLKVKDYFNDYIEQNLSQLQLD